MIGAGVGRTGTASLKLALERLLDAPCYHQTELFAHPERTYLWRSAAMGAMPEWDEVFDGYVATVSWPGAAYWREISAAYPGAVVLLSTRGSSDEWYASAAATILATNYEPPRFDLADPVASYEAHNDSVRSSVPIERLIEWQPGDGWQPLCDALGLDVPDESFPHVNTTAEFCERYLEPLRGTP